MRATATTEVVDFFASLNIPRRITWIDLWNTIEEASKWEANISIDRECVITFTDKQTEEVLSKYSCNRSLVFNEDVDEDALAYVLVMCVMEHNLWKKSKKKFKNPITKEYVAPKVTSKPTPKSSPEPISYSKVCEMKQDAQRMYQRIYDHKKKGADISSELLEYQALKNKIKEAESRLKK